LDLPVRQALWPELAALNTALGHAADAAVCWLHALWDADLPPPNWMRLWIQAEAKTAPADVTAGLIERWCSDTVSPSTSLRSLLAYLLWGAYQQPAPPPLRQRLGVIQEYLRAHEGLLPVRGVWLAWSALSQLTSDGTSELQKARARLLERLFASGLELERDFPSFLSFSGQASGNRSRARTWLSDLSNLAHAWIKKNSKEGTVSAPNIPTTSAYADLIFAFALARLGEGDASRGLAERADSVLTGKDPVHSLLYRSFRYRIEKALARKPNAGPLPEDVLGNLRILDKMRGFIVDRLRQHSRILEPDQNIDPYRIWAPMMGDLEKALSQIPDLQDRKEIAARFEKLLAEEAKGPKAAEIKARILRAALDLAPRVGEEFAMNMLGRVGPAYDGLPEAKEPKEAQNKAALLEKGMFVAAHFGRREHIEALVNRFQRRLGSQRGPDVVQAVDRLANQCFRGLRKLGMRDEIELLLKQMADLILKSQGVEDDSDLLDVAAKDGPHLNDAVWLAALRALLHVASGWFYFGKDKLAEPVLNAARTLLFRAVLNRQEQTLLACTYAQSLGQAPVELAQKRIEEMFQKLDGVRDSFTTNTHYGMLQLDVIEAVVLSVVTDDFTLGFLGRTLNRWVDDDERLIRTRLSADVDRLPSPGAG
jgi:hypothetical protein